MGKFLRTVVFIFTIAVYIAAYFISSPDSALTAQQIETAIGHQIFTGPPTISATFFWINVILSVFLIKCFIKIIFDYAKKGHQYLCVGIMMETILLVVPALFGLETDILLKPLGLILSLLVSSVLITIAKLLIYLVFRQKTDQGSEQFAA